MNLTQLKYFKAVCIYKTVSAAAEYLHISQPSLSNAIKEMEKEFGVSLFSRCHRGMVLTAEGEILFKMCDDVLERAEEMEKVMNDLGTERKRLRVGIPPMIGSLLLPHIYSNFLGANPEITLEITEGGSIELKKLLEEDYVDMIFLPHSKPFENNLSYSNVKRLEIVCAAAKNNPVSKFTAVTPKMLENTPLVLFENSFFQTEEIKKWFEVENIKPDILLQTKQLSTMQSIISNNIAAGFMFRELIDTTGIVPVPISNPMFVDVSLVWKKDAYMSSSMKRLREYIKKY